MNAKELKQAIRAIAGQGLEERTHWYSSSAEAYNATRPKYPIELIHEAIKIAQLSPSSRILEIGSGPATATTAFAELGCSMVCLEPNSDFHKLALIHCQAYASVEVINTSFEEWQLEPEAFDAVLAASSMHWIPSEIGYAKANASLKDDGYFILLWNKELQPCMATHHTLADVYQRHAPSLHRYEDRQTQEQILAGLGQMMVDSGKFRNLVATTIETTLTYTPDQYLSLLSTYSSYLKLDRRIRNALFTDLKQRFLENGDTKIPLTYSSTYHIAQKLAHSDQSNA